MKKVEIFISSFSAVACAGLTLYLMYWLATFQSIWPFPGLYLIELAALALLAWFLSFRQLPHAAIVIWTIAGVFLAFSVLAGFTIGFLYFPFVLLLGAVATLIDLRQKIIRWTHIGMVFIGALAQASIILAILQFIFKTPIIR